VKFAGRVKFGTMAQVKLQAKLAVAEVFIKEIHNFFANDKKHHFCETKIALNEIKLHF
jgi:hypothetical protein